MKSILEIHHLINNVPSPSIFEIETDSFNINEETVSFKITTGATVAFMNHSIQVFFVREVTNETQS